MVINLELIDFGLSPCYLQTCGSSRVQGGVPESTPPYLPFLTKGCPLPHNWVLGFWLHVGERSHPAELSVFPLRTLTESQYSLLSIILGRRKGKDGQSSIAAVNLRPSLDPLAPTAGLIWHWHPKFCLAVLGNERYSQHHPLLLSGILKTEGVRALFFFLLMPRRCFWRSAFYVSSTRNTSDIRKKTMNWFYIVKCFAFPHHSFSD